MTVEELIELLQKENPQHEVVLHLIRYTKHRHISRATRPVTYPIASVGLAVGRKQIYLMPDQKGDYG